jgi:hypothetical protein
MLIGLSGKKQSGKSSVTSYLCEVFDFHEVLWAYPLKEIIGRDLFGLDDEILYGDSPKREEIIPEWGMSGREILQRVGTNLFREHFHPDFWVMVGMRRITELTGRGQHVVVSDCRFPNEIEAIHKLGGHSARIIRLSQESTDMHPSETALDNYEHWDYVLPAADGDLPGLKAQARRMIHNIKGVD